jgi:3-phenylpropionate/trans-cinnamate dioxygenase ferredoxin reductase subunit
MSEPFSPVDATTFDILIVGAGHAGAQAAIALRQNGYEGSIGLLGDEAELPYERPPLSKDYLLGQRPFEKLLIRPAQFWEDRKISMLPGVRVDAVDAALHEVLTQDGRTLGYDKLIWATGGAARRLDEGHHLFGVHTVRSRADVNRMMDELDNVQSVVVIGGGYIGLEAAAVMAKRGKRVTILEAADRVLARVAGEPLSRFYEGEHRAHGADIRLGAKVAQLEEANGSVTGVRLDDGEVLDAQMVIVGIGIVPSVQPLLASGASGGNGVDVDDYCCTSLPDVFAIGDCAAQTHDFADGARIRLESVQNANDQAVVVARYLTGKEQAQRQVPRFWSDQFDLKLQTIGLSRDYDEVLTRGDPASRSFSVAYLRQGQLIAMDCVNAPKDFVQARVLIAARACPDRQQLIDPSLPLAASPTA